MGKVYIADDLLMQMRAQYKDWSTYGCVEPVATDERIIAIIVTLWIEDNAEHCKKLCEIRMARKNGGRTPYMFDNSGNEYYTTVDGVRHYTRVEG